MTADDEARMSNPREGRLTPPGSPKRSQLGSGYDTRRGNSTGRSSPSRAVNTSTAAEKSKGTNSSNGNGKSNGRGGGIKGGNHSGGGNVSQGPTYGTSSTGDEFLGIFHPSETVPTKSVLLPRSKTVITFRAPPTQPPTDGGKGVAASSSATAAGADGHENASARANVTFVDIHSVNPSTRTAPTLPPEARAAAWVLKGDALCRGQHHALVEAACRGSEASLAVARVRKTLMLNHPGNAESVTALRQLRAAVGAYSCAVAVMEEAEGTSDKRQSLSVQPELLLKRAEALEVLACAAEALPEASAEAKIAAENDYAVALRSANGGESASKDVSKGAGAADAVIAGAEEEAGAAAPQDSSHCLSLALVDVTAALTLDPSGKHSPLGVGAAWLMRSRLLRHLSHQWGIASTSSSSSAASSSPSRMRKSSSVGAGVVVDVSLLAEAVESARHAHSLSVSAFAEGLDPAKTAAGGISSNDAGADPAANGVNDATSSSALQDSAAAAVSVGRAVTDLKRELKLATEAQRSAGHLVSERKDTNNLSSVSHSFQHHGHHPQSLSTGNAASTAAGPPNDLQAPVQHSAPSQGVPNDEFRLSESGTKRSRRAPAASDDEASSSLSSSFVVQENPTSSSSGGGVMSGGWPPSFTASAPAAESVFSAPQSELSTSDASTLSHAMEMMAKSHADKVAEMERNHAQEVLVRAFVVVYACALMEANVFF